MKNLTYVTACFAWFVLAGLFNGLSQGLKDNFWLSGLAWFAGIVCVVVGVMIATAYHKLK